MVKYYAVKNGRGGPNIYTTWPECQAQVNGFSGAVFKSFPTYDQALEFIGSSNPSSSHPSPSPNPGPSPSSYPGPNPSPTRVMPSLTLSSTPVSLGMRVLRIKANFSGLTLPDIQADPDFMHQLSITNYPEIVIYTDGSHSSNTKIAGSGIYLSQFNLGITVNVPGDQTNNRGELWAAIYGNEFIQAHLRGLGRSPVPVVIHSDSTYVINKLSQNATTNHDLVGLLRLQKQHYPFRFVKALAHSGDPGNERADQLAKMSAGL